MRSLLVVSLSVADAGIVLKVSQYVTLTAQRKCHPPRGSVTEVEKKSHSSETGQMGGTLGSPHSEIVR